MCSKWIFNLFSSCCPPCGVEEDPIPLRRRTRHDTPPLDKTVFGDNGAAAYEHFVASPQRINPSLVQERVHNTPPALPPRNIGQASTSGHASTRLAALPPRNIGQASTSGHASTRLAALPPRNIGQASTSGHASTSGRQEQDDGFYVRLAAPKVDCGYHQFVHNLYVDLENEDSEGYLKPISRKECVKPK